MLRYLPLLALVWSPAASAVDIVVSQAGDQDHSTIGSAIAVAQPGDRILVGPGTYAEALYILSNTLTLEAQDPASPPVVTSPGPFGVYLLRIDSPLSQVTVRGIVFDGLQERRPLEVSNGAGAVFDGVTVRNGVNADGFAGGGLDVFNGATATVISSSFDANSALDPALGRDLGGHIAVEAGSSVVLQNSVLQTGQAGRGGGLWLEAGAQAQVIETQFVQNSAGRPTDADGGGICAELGAELAVADSGFEANSAGTDLDSMGGGIYSAAGLTVVTGSQFGNNGAHLGGGLAVEGGSLVASSNTWTFNSADKGGGVGCYRTSLCGVLEDRFEGNDGGYGGGLYALESAVVVGASQFCSNETSVGNYIDADGGGIAVNRSSLTVFNTAFAQNIAAGGGGALSGLDALVDASNNHFIGNSAGGEGGGVYAIDTEGWNLPATSVNDLFFFDNAVQAAGAIHAGPGVAGSLEYAWLYDNSPDHGTIGASPTLYVDVADPGLAGWAPGSACDPESWLPAPGSPLIDAGDPTRSDPDGSVSDIGVSGGSAYPDNALDDADLDGVPTFFDCNDNDPTIHLGTRWYRDADGDGFGWYATWLVDCTQPPGFVASETDCDDTDPALNPFTAWFPDADDDGWGDTSLGVQGCDPGPGHVLQGGDCNDENSGIHPGKPELCDGVDQDCDGAIDEETADGVTGFVDADGDGYGSGDVQNTCDEGRLVDNADDCNDEDPTIHPGAEDVWYDGVDSDCGGQDDFDADGDGFPLETDCDDTSPVVFPGADDPLDDGIDQDCNGTPARSWVSGGGCACDGTGSGSGGLWVMALGLLALRRRD